MGSGEEREGKEKGVENEEENERRRISAISSSTAEQNNDNNITTTQQRQQHNNDNNISSNPPTHPAPCKVEHNIVIVVSAGELLDRTGPTGPTGPLHGVIGQNIRTARRQQRGDSSTGRSTRGILAGIKSEHHPTLIWLKLSSQFCYPSIPINTVPAVIHAVHAAARVVTAIEASAQRALSTSTAKYRPNTPPTFFIHPHLLSYVAPPRILHLHNTASCCAVVSCALLCPAFLLQDVQ